MEKVTKIIKIKIPEELKKKIERLNIAVKEVQEAIEDMKNN